MVVLGCVSDCSHGSQCDEVAEVERQLSVHQTLTIAVDGLDLHFQRMELVFVQCRISNVFAHKNNRTLRETLAHRRYASLSDVVMSRYHGALDVPLGAFLLQLKESGDPFNRRFLNPYGDSVYCTSRSSITQ
jgi:hypothetical protein